MRKTASKNNNITMPILLIFLLVILGSGCGYNPEPGWKPAENTHDIMYSDSFRIIWDRPGVFIGISWGDLNLAAYGSRVIFLGSLDIGKSSSVIALDALTGEFVWETNPKPPSTIFVSQDGLYVGEAGGGSRVTSYDLDTGEIRWSKLFLNSSGVESLIVYKNQLHAYIAPDMHKILNTLNGKIITSILPTPPPFFDSTVCGDIYQVPIYTDDTIYFRTGRNLEVGNVCAVDISTGELRWKSDLSVVSNVVASDDAVFILVESGDLLALNPATGVEISPLEISFSNKPFILYKPYIEVGNYFVAYDAENDILLAYLGDSRQLFAFKTK